MHICAVTRTALAVISFAIGSAVAGPLDPPPGAIAPTHKTLTEVEPRIAVNSTNTPAGVNSLFRLSQPGSYYLTGNITGIVGKDGIEIGASGVTLDLNGFELIGVAAMGAFDGVTSNQGSLTNITIRNGSIRNWGADGLDLANFNPTNCRIEGVLAAGNVSDGIRVGPNSTVTHCSANANGGDGIDANLGLGSKITNCTARANTLSGIAVSFGCSVTDCAAADNSAQGIVSSTGGVIINCTAHSNTGVGIQIGVGGMAAQCSATSNTGSGLSVADGCTISDCSASSNGLHGFSAGSTCTIAGCSASSNVGTGILAGNGCTVTNCSAQQNTGSGIAVAAGCVVADCASRFNTLDGILCSMSCVIRGNTCANNGVGAGSGAGIHATSADNRIEGNNCIGVGQDRGIDVDAAGNFITRNTCSGNTTNWDVVASNKCLVVVGGNAAAILGDSGGIAPGSTDPNANFTY